MLLCPILYVALVIIPTVRSRDTFKRVPLLPEPLWRSPETVLHQNRVGAASTAFWFCSACSACTLLTPPFCPKVVVRVRACVSVCVCVFRCARAQARAGQSLFASCQPVEMVCRPSCVYAQGGQINISEEQYELNHFLNNKKPPHASS